MRAGTVHRISNSGYSAGQCWRLPTCVLPVRGIHREGARIQLYAASHCHLVLCLWKSLYRGPHSKTDRTSEHVAEMGCLVSHYLHRNCQHPELHIQLCSVQSSKRELGSASKAQCHMLGWHGTAEIRLLYVWYEGHLFLSSGPMD